MADDRQGMLRVIFEGWAYVAQTPLVRGLVIGITGAFAAGGVVIGLARVYVADLGEATRATACCSLLSSPGWRWECGERHDCWSPFRVRACSVCLVSSGLALAAIAIIANLVAVTILAVALGLLHRCRLDYRSDAARPRGRRRPAWAHIRLCADAHPLGSWLSCWRWLRCCQGSSAGIVGSSTTTPCSDYNGAAITIFLAAIAMIACRTSFLPFT
ncbi:MAG: hypothetical protein WKF73_15750 [Nocardioidaceae bacterium]